MNTRTTAGMGLALALLFGPLPALAQVCDTEVVVKDEDEIETPYELRGAVCEGMYSQVVALGGLEVVGLFEGEALEDYERDDTLYLSAPRASAGQVAVRAQGHQKRYRMDTLITAGEVVAWPVDPVLVAENIRPHEFQIQGRLGDDRLVPVRVGGDPDRDRGSVTVQLLSDREIRDVTYAVGDTCEVLKPAKTTSSGKHRSQTPFVGFVLDSDLRGDKCVRIEATDNVDGKTRIHTEVKLWLGDEH